MTRGVFAVVRQTPQRKAHVLCAECILYAWKVLMGRAFTNKTFRILEIPDPRFSQFQAVAGGDVRKTIWQAWEHILRTLTTHGV